MDTLFSCVSWSDDTERQIGQTSNFESTASAYKLHEEAAESDELLRLTEDEVRTLITDFNDSKNISAALSISSKCSDYRPAFVALYELCRAAVTNFEILGNGGVCPLLLQLLRAHRDTTEIVLLSLGAMFCMMQSEINTQCFLDNGICDDLEWILQQFNWSHKIPDASCPSPAFHDLDGAYRTYHMRLRVVGWTVHTVRVICRNESEGRLAMNSKQIHGEIHTFLNELLKFLKYGDDMKQLLPPGANGDVSSVLDADLFALFQRTRTPSGSILTNSFTQTPVPAPDFAASLSQCLRHPVNFFVTVCCDTISQLSGRGKDKTSLQRFASLGLRNLLEAGSLPTRHSLYVGASESSFGALRSAKRTLFENTRESSSSDDGMVGSCSDGSESFSYYVEKDLLVQVLWDILTYVKADGNFNSLSVFQLSTPGKKILSSSSAAAMSPGPTNDVAQILSRLYDDVLHRAMVLASVIVSQREEKWRLDVESQVLHKTVQASLVNIDESRRLYDAEKRRLEELIRTLKEEQRMRQELEHTISELETSRSQGLSELLSLEKKSQIAAKEHEHVMGRLNETVASTEMILKGLNEKEVQSARALSEILCARATAELRLAEVDARTLQEKESLLHIAEEGVSHVAANIRRGLMGTESSSSGTGYCGGGGGSFRDGINTGGKVPGGGVMQQFRTFFSHSASPAADGSDTGLPLAAASLTSAPLQSPARLHGEASSSRYANPTHSSSRHGLRPDQEVSVNTQVTVGDTNGDKTTPSHPRVSSQCTTSAQIPSPTRKSASGKTALEPSLRRQRSLPGVVMSSVSDARHLVSSSSQLSPSSPKYSPGKDKSDISQRKRLIGFDDQVSSDMLAQAFATSKRPSESPSRSHSNDGDAASTTRTASSVHNSSHGVIGSSSREIYSVQNSSAASTKSTSTPHRDTSTADCSLLPPPLPAISDDDQILRLTSLYLRSPQPAVSPRLSHTEGSKVKAPADVLI